MEARGRDGGGGLWSYREQIGISGSCTISSSSTSGTVSTGDTSSSTCGSWRSMEAARHLREIMEEEEEEDTDGEFVQRGRKKPRKERDQEKEVEKIKESYQEKEVEKIKILAREFFGAAPGVCSIQGADMSVLKRWFQELGVGWVLHLPLADGASTCWSRSRSWSWSWTFTKIMKMLAFVENATVTEERDITGQLQFALFIHQAMLKMLASVDVIISAPNLICALTVTANPPSQKLDALLLVHNALSNSSFCTGDDARIEGEIFSVLSEKEDRLAEAIWSIMEEIRNRILESTTEDGGDGSSTTKTPQGSSSEIHKATRSLMNYIRFLWRHHRSVGTIVSQHAASLRNEIIGDPATNLSTLAIDMVSCLQEKLAKKSQAFADQSLRFLFLLNNSSYIRDELVHCPSYKAALTAKLQRDKESYMQVSWEPVLLCLVNRPNKPLNILRKNYSPLLLNKFESEFQKTYTTQKLWRVPDPRLRKTLRAAIAKKIIPAYTRHIEEDNIVTSPKFTPQNLAEMLRELFEG